MDTYEEKPAADHQKGGSSAIYGNPQETSTFSSVPVAAQRESTMTVYVLYLVGFAISLTPVIGLIMAYIKRGNAEEVAKSHYNNQIAIFWRGILIMVGIFVLYMSGGYLASVFSDNSVVLALVLMIVPVIAGLYWFIWTIIKVVTGMQALSRGQPVRKFSKVYMETSIGDNITPNI